MQLASSRIPDVLFDRKLEKIPLGEKKFLVYQFIRQIDVDRRRNVARIYLTKVPALLPGVEQLYANKKVLTEVVGPQSGRGPPSQKRSGW